MEYTSRYPSPLGEILLAADDVGLTGLWFEDQKHFARQLSAQHRQKEVPVFAETRRWLDAYFSGEKPEALPPVHLMGTPFQMAVWAMLLEIPYGKITTYGALAKALAQSKGLPRMSAQAVGNAVGRNPISILIPCHRVLGAGGRLTGYAGGLERKKALLKLEGHTFSNTT